MREIVVSKSAGFCFGVSRSVELAEALLKKGEGSCWSLGELIHNEHVVSELRSRGLQRYLGDKVGIMASLREKTGL